MSLADVTANLRAPVVTRVDDRGPTVKVHAAEWRKVMAGEPVEINPSVSAVVEWGWGEVGLDVWGAGRAQCVGCGWGVGGSSVPQLRCGLRPRCAPGPA